MRGQFLARGPFKHGLGDLAEQTVRAEQFYALCLSGREQLVGHRWMHQRFPSGRSACLGRYLSVKHSVIPSEPFPRASTFRSKVSGPGHAAPDDPSPNYPARSRTGSSPPPDGDKVEQLPGTVQRQIRDPLCDNLFVPVKGAPLAQATAFAVGGHATATNGLSGAARRYSSLVLMR